MTLLDQIAERPSLPPFRDGAEGGVDEGDGFVAGEAEVDEPLAVEGLRHLLQYPDAPQVVLDQVVVGREDPGNSALGGEVGERDWKLRKCRQGNAINRSAGQHVVPDHLPPLLAEEVVVKKTSIDLLLVRSDESHSPPKTTKKALGNDRIPIQSCLVGKDDVPRTRPRNF